jgi:hypothetical protein
MFILAVIHKIETYERSDHNAETCEGQSCEVTKIIDLGTLRDIP